MKIVEEIKTMSKHRAEGFTLLELLVVITVLAVLLALAVPAVNFARERARLNQCRGNVGQLALALANHESTFGNFPPGVPVCGDDPLKTLGRETGNTCSGPSWAVAILPYLNENAMYDDVLTCMAEEWSFCDDCQHPKYGGGVGPTVPKYMLCPSAPVNPILHGSSVTHLDNIAKGNYAASYGAWKYAQAIENGPPQDAQGVGTAPSYSDAPRWHEAIGILSVSPFRHRGPNVSNGIVRCGSVWRLGSRQGVSIRKVRDGLAKTIIVSELLNDTKQDDVRGIWTSGAMGAAAFSAYNPPNSVRGDVYTTYLWKEEGKPQIEMGGIIGGDFVTGCTRSPSDRSLRCQGVASQNGNEWAAARSKHRGGVVVAFADGATGFVTNNIELHVWQAMNSRAGNVVAAPDETTTHER